MKRERITAIIVGLCFLVACAPAEQTIDTPKGSFVVPGTAFMDGRDPDARPPMTVMRINVRNGVHGRSMRGVLCDVLHGTEVQLLSARYNSSESRYYFQIKVGACKGWVAAPFLAQQWKPPEGDQM